MKNKPFGLIAWVKDLNYYVVPVAVYFDIYSIPARIDYYYNGQLKTATEGEFTLKKFTGMLDKNGFDIFDGDRIKCWSEGCGRVYFDTESLQYRVKFDNGVYKNLADCKDENPEIISNSTGEE